MFWPITAEFSDTRATNHHGTSGTNLTYNHTTYSSGYCYHERTLAHSLDNDSVLFSLAASLTDIRSWTYRLAYHRAEINLDGSISGSRVRPSFMRVMRASASVGLTHSAFDTVLLRLHGRARQSG